MQLGEISVGVLPDLKQLGVRVACGGFLTSGRFGASATQKRQGAIGVTIERDLELGDCRLGVACAQEHFSEQFMRGLFNRRSGRTRGFAFDFGRFAQGGNRRRKVTRVGASETGELQLTKLREAGCIRRAFRIGDSRQVPDRNLRFR